jgi:hypothetical protein
MPQGLGPSYPYGLTTGFGARSGFLHQIGLGVQVLSIGFASQRRVNGHYNRSLHTSVRFDYASDVAAVVPFDPVGDKWIRDSDFHVPVFNSQTGAVLEPGVVFPRPNFFSQHFINLLRCVFRTRRPCRSSHGNPFARQLKKIKTTKRPLPGQASQ